MNIYAAGLLVLAVLIVFAGPPILGLLDRIRRHRQRRRVARARLELQQLERQHQQAVRAEELSACRKSSATLSASRHQWGARNGARESQISPRPCGVSRPLACWTRRFALREVSLARRHKRARTRGA